MKNIVVGADEDLIKEALQYVKTFTIWEIVK